MCERVRLSMDNFYTPVLCVCVWVGKVIHGQCRFLTVHGHHCPVCHCGGCAGACARACACVCVCRNMISQRKKANSNKRLSRRTQSWHAAWKSAPTACLTRPARWRRCRGNVSAPQSCLCRKQSTALQSNKRHGRLKHHRRFFFFFFALSFF